MVVGADVVEIEMNPAYHPTQVTARLVVTVAAEIRALVAARRHDLRS